MIEILDPIFDFFVALFHADRRSEARRFTIGWLLVVLILVGLLVVIFWDVDTSS